MNSEQFNVIIKRHEQLDKKLERLIELIDEEKHTFRKPFCDHIREHHEHIQFSEYSGQASDGVLYHCKPHYRGFTDMSIGRSILGGWDRKIDLSYVCYGRVGIFDGHWGGEDVYWKVPVIFFTDIEEFKRLVKQRDENIASDRSEKDRVEYLKLKQQFES